MAADLTRRFPTNLLLVPVVAALLGVLAGCGGSSASAPACNLVTTSEIAAAYGGTVSPGIPNITPGVTDSSSCVYAVKGSNVGIDRDVEVGVLPRQSLSSFQTWANEPLSGHVSLSGLGDAAFYDGNGGGVTFLKGSQPYGVGMGLLAGTTRDEILKAHGDDMELATVLAGKV